MFVINLLFSVLMMSATADAACPMQAYPSPHTQETILWDTGTPGVHEWRTGYGWSATPYTADPTVQDFYGDFTAVATTSTSIEWSMGINTSGELVTWGGQGVTTGTPSGDEPYLSVATGSTGRMAVTNRYREIEVWGNNTANFTSVPTGSFNRLGVGRDVGCASNSTTNTGVTCWGVNTEGLVTHADIPTTGYYDYIDVGRYAAFAVDVDGNMVGWGTTRTASNPALVQAFIDNAPTTGVRRVQVNEVSTLFGVAWMLDGTVVIWQGNGGLVDVITGAPGWDTYGDNSLKYYIPEGPDGYITWRSLPRIAIQDNGTIAGVINDGQGLIEGSNTYEYGDAYVWSEAVSYAQLIDVCD